MHPSETDTVIDAAAPANDDPSIDPDCIAAADELADLVESADGTWDAVAAARIAEVKTRLNQLCIEVILRSGCDPVQARERYIGVERIGTHDIGDLLSSATSKSKPPARAWYMKS